MSILKQYDELVYEAHAYWRRLGKKLYGPFWQLNKQTIAEAYEAERHQPPKATKQPTTFLGKAWQWLVRWFRGERLLDRYRQLDVRLNNQLDVLYTLSMIDLVTL